MNTDDQSLRNNKRDESGFNLKAGKLILYLFVVVLLQSWVADGIEGNTLFTWLCGGLSLKDQPGWSSLLLLIMTVMSGLLAYWIFQDRRTFIPIQVQRIGKPDDVQPHAILVLTVSYPGTWRIDMTNKKIHNKDKEVSLDGTLDDVLTRLASLGERERFAWEQLLRAMRKHAEGGNLRQVYLVGSPGANGTDLKFNECRDLLHLFYPMVAPDIFRREEAGFDDVDGLIAVYRAIIQRAGKDKRQVMIDVTGGTKVVSIAAAMVTMEHPQIEFQYVETEGGKRVRSFNVTGSGYEHEQ